MIVVPYSVNYKTAWDEFVRTSKNGTFLIERGFMDYHADRFFDCSVLVFEGENEQDNGHISPEGLMAVFPANWVEEDKTVWSHQGLTYGGLVTALEVTQQEVLEMSQAIIRYYRDRLQARRMVCKPIPYIYSSIPSGEGLYALFRAGARLLARNVATVVPMRNQLRMRTLRQRQAKKALDNGFYIDRLVEGDREGLHEYWQLLDQVLMQHHGVHPLHTENEMALLMSRFPREIKLYLVRHEQRTVAGCVVFVSRQVVHMQYIASGAEGREYGALDLLFRHLINERYKQMEYIDFGTSNEQCGRKLNEGLIFQKEGFGGRAVCYDWYEVELANPAIETMAGQTIERNDSDIRYLDIKAINDSFEPRLTESIERVLRAGCYTIGKACRDFESAFAKFIGSNQCVMVGNGTDALTLTLRAYKTMNDWQDGDEVIVPANTSVPTIRAIEEAGLTPILCEPRIQDFLIDPKAIPQLIGERTRAIIPVHLFGRICQMKEINKLAQKNGLKVIEDASHAHGAMQDGQRAGHLGDCAAFSLGPGKNLGAMGNAGCVCTDDRQLADIVRTMANQGQTENGTYTYRGMNSRTDEFQAAVLVVKLPRLDEDNQRRREIAEIYARGIQNPLVSPPPMPQQAEENVWYAYPVRCPARDALQQRLRECGIQTITHNSTAPHRQQVFGSWSERRLPVSERLCREELSLPISPLMTYAEAERIVKVINEFNIDL